MANYGAMIWLETRAGTSTLTPITATTYPSNEFNTNGDNIQAKASFPYVYYTSTGSLTEALQGSINSATNSAQPTTMDKISIDPTTHKSMGLNATFDYRANTLKKVFSPIEDVTSNLKSTGTTSEVCWNIVGVTDQAASITSGTVNTTLTNFPLVFDNSLTTLPNPLYEIVKADVCSPVGANKLLFSGIKFSNIVHALPLIPRSSNLTPVSPLNNIPSGFIFDSNTPPEIQLLSSNSATADIVVNFYLKKR